MLTTTTAGELDRLVAIERKSVTRHPTLGSEVVAWVPLLALWWVKFMEQPVEPTSGLGKDEAAAAAYVPAKVRGRWLPGVDATMRLNEQGRLWQITAVAAVGRQQWLDLSLRDWAHE